MNVESTSAIDGDHQHGIGTRGPALKFISNVSDADAVAADVDASIHTPDPDRDQRVVVAAGVLKRCIDEEFSRDRHDNDNDNKGYGGDDSCSNKDDTKRIRWQYSNDAQQQSSLSAVSGITTVHERSNTNRSTSDTDTSSCIISNCNNINDNITSPKNSNINNKTKNNLPSTPSSLRATTIAMMPLTDIYGRVPGKEPSHTIPCPNDNCSRHLASSRLASHLEKCLGLVFLSRRGSGGSVKLSSTEGAAAANTIAMKTNAKTVGGNKKMVKPGKQTRRRSSKFK